MTRIIKEETANGNDVLVVVAFDETTACEAVQEYLDAKDDAEEYEYEAKAAWELDNEELTKDEINEEMKAFRVPYNVFDK